tara:strand:- start:406 stop:552 length:147 start_codon:yes stop_codon:yes gene_type:complete
MEFTTEAAKRVSEKCLRFLGEHLSKIKINFKTKVRRPDAEQMHIRHYG